MTGQIVFGPYVLYKKPQRLERNGEPVELRNQALNLLVLMVEQPGDLLTHEDIREKLWSDRHVDYSGGIHLLIGEIRKALEDDAKAPVYVETVPRQGYRFIGSVKSAGNGTVAASTPAFQLPRAAMIGGIALLLVGAMASAQFSSSFLSVEGADNLNKAPASREAYSKAAYLLELGDPESLAKAKIEFAKAIEAGADVAPSEAGLAAIALRSGKYDTAELHAHRARTADPGNAAAHFYLGVVEMRRDWNWEEAEANLIEAIRLDPENAEFHSANAMLLTTMGRNEEALKASDTAYNLDPASALVARDHGWTYLYAGEFDRAHEYCSQAVYLDPQNLTGAVCQYKASLRRGNYSDAKTAAAKIVSIMPAGPALVKAVEEEPPKKSIEEFHAWLRAFLESENASPNITAADKAVLFAEMNEFDIAFELISAAASERSSNLPFYLRDPVFRPVAGSEQFLEALEIAGL